MSINYDKLPTYFAATTTFTPGTQDMFTIYGNATTNIYVLKTGVSSIQTTTGIQRFHLKRKTAVNSGGTNAVVTAVNANANNIAASATVLQYTVNPTVSGGSTEILDGNNLSLSLTSSGASSQILMMDFETAIGGPLVLASSTQGMAWNFNGVAIPAGFKALVWVLWAEGPKT